MRFRKGNITLPFDKAIARLIPGIQVGRTGMRFPWSKSGDQLLIHGLDSRLMRSYWSALERLNLRRVLNDGVLLHGFHGYVGCAGQLNEKGELVGLAVHEHDLPHSENPQVVFKFKPRISKSGTTITMHFTIDYIKVLSGSSHQLAQKAVNNLALATFFWNLKRESINP